MSGTNFLIKPLPLAMHEQNYKQAIAALGLTNASTERRLSTLLKTPGQDLIARIPQSALSLPAIDGDIVPSTLATYAQTADRDADVPMGKAWCEDLMIGNTQMDVSLCDKLLSMAS